MAPSAREATRIAVLDTEAGTIQLIQSALDRRDTVVCGFRTIRDFLAAGALDSWDAVLSELRLPDGDGLELMRRVRRAVPGARFVLMAADAPVSVVVEAMKEGAADFLQKPFRLSKLRESILAAPEESSPGATGPADPANPVPRPAGADTEAVGRSAAWRELLARADKVAATSSTVLIRGETGCGKEVLARYVVSRGPRSRGPFVEVNCSAMAETLVESELFGHARGAFTGATVSRPGLFEEASGGTIFLDEIGTMPFPAQAKILRVLEEKKVRRVGESSSIPVDVRVIAATNLEIESAVARREFREDLYYRLAVVTLRIAPLRERRDDIPVLAAHFLRRLALPGEAPKRLSEAAIQLLLGYPFPGNVRELKHALEQAVVFSSGDELRPADFTSLAARAQMMPGHRDPSGIFSAPEPVTAERLLEALRATSGNRVEAARSLNISRSTLYRLLRQITETSPSDSFARSIPVS